MKLNPPTPFKKGGLKGAPLLEGISLIPALIASGLVMCHLKQEGNFGNDFYQKIPFRASPI